MKFKFSLEPVLKVRKHQEKMQKLRLAEEVMKREEIEQVKQDVNEKLQDFLEAGQADQAANIHNVRLYSTHIQEAHHVMKQLNEKAGEAEKRVGEEREKLTQAHKNKHILMKLKEAEERIFKKELNRYEQKTMDEIATQSFGR